MANVLVIDPDANVDETMQALLEGFEVHFCNSEASAQDFLKKRVKLDLVVVALEIVGVAELISSLRLMTEVPPIIATTRRFDSREGGLAKKQWGAVDYLKKPFKTTPFRSAVSRALLLRSPTGGLDTTELQKLESLESKIIGDSPAIIDLRRKIVKIARSSGSVLITGEPGTGKELVARAIHDLGPQKSGPLVSFNIAHLVESDSVDSQLFGHVKGSFTGAVVNHIGIFEQAEGGTLFLDEIGVLPWVSQSKLLRALQEHEIRPVGAEGTFNASCRIVFGTNEDVEQLVKDEKFRLDLYGRIKRNHIRVPPLRGRGEDWLVLARHFLNELNRKPPGRNVVLSEEAELELKSRDFPNNVRDLKTIIEDAFEQCIDSRISFDDVVDQFSGEVISQLEKWPEHLFAKSHKEAVEWLENHFNHFYLLRRYEESGKHVPTTIKSIGIKSTATFYTKWDAAQPPLSDLPGRKRDRKK
jgi:DNA-binding NtrC family response regulator